jgi:hypothetical protein
MMIATPLEPDPDSATNHRDDRYADVKPLVALCKPRSHKFVLEDGSMRSLTSILSLAGTTILALVHDMERAMRGSAPSKHQLVAARELLDRANETFRKNRSD